MLFSFSIGLFWGFVWGFITFYFTLFFFFGWVVVTRPSIGGSDFHFVWTEICQFLRPSRLGNSVVISSFNCEGKFIHWFFFFKIKGWRRSLDLTFNYHLNLVELLDKLTLASFRLLEDGRIDGKSFVLCFSLKFASYCWVVDFLEEILQHKWRRSSFYFFNEVVSLFALSFMMEKFLWRLVNGFYDPLHRLHWFSLL